MSSQNNLQIPSLKKYRNHLAKNLTVESISLNQYLSVVAICYRAAFGEKTRGLKPIDMYLKWADGRHGGMLDIKDWNSEKEFDEWLNGKKIPGSHPFEIIFSFIEKGVCLFPPLKQRNYFTLRCPTYLFADVYVAIVLELIKNDIPFKAPDLENMLDYLTGEKLFDVNSGHPLISLKFWEEKEYFERYFRHIKWDKLEYPKWKKLFR